SSTPVAASITMVLMISSVIFSKGDVTAQCAVGNYVPEGCPAAGSVDEATARANPRPTNDELCAIRIGVFPPIAESIRGPRGADRALMWATGAAVRRVLPVVHLRGMDGLYLNEARVKL